MAKKHNTPGFGIEYEILVPAYFALSLHRNENVKDYTIRSNVANFGNMDDVVVDIEMANNTQHFFAIQLKHKENQTTKLLPTNFEARGDFSLEKYCKAFNSIDVRNQHYHFILYTNREYNPSSRQELKHFRVVKDHCAGEAFFNSGSKSDSVYRVEVKETYSGNEITKCDYEKFFGRFRVYVGQKSFKGLKGEILDMLNKNERAMLRYLEVFRTWHQNGYTDKTIDQTTVDFHLVDIFLSDFVETSVQLSNEADENLELFERAVREFDVTIINESKKIMIEALLEYEEVEISEHIKQFLDFYIQKYKLEVTQNDDPNETMLHCMLYLGKKYKFLDRFFNKDTLAADIKKKKKVLYYFFGKPLLVYYNESSAESFYHVMKLYHKNKKKIKFVLLGYGVDKTKLSKFTIFEKLDDLLKVDNFYREMLKKCTLSLQGKDRITLEELVQSLGNADFITVKEIFRMLTSNFVIGEDTEVLPLNHIPRKISTLVLKTGSLLDPNFLFKNNIFIIDFGGKFEQIRSVLEENNIAIIELRVFNELTEFPQKTTIIPVDNECHLDVFKQILEKTKTRNLLHLKMVDSDIFIPVMLENTDPAFFSEIDVDEKEVHQYCVSTVNILCAQPGMGKSTLCKSLQKQLPNIWTVIVDLKAYNGFLNEKHNINEVLQHFLRPSKYPFLDKIKNAFLETKKVVFFLDGLDELDSTSIETLLDYAECMSNLGLRVWISSRQNLKEKLISRFKKFTINLTEVNKSEQIQYIKNRLCGQYQDEEIHRVTEKIFNSTDLINNRQVLGIPLQLYIVTQIFLDDEEHFRSTAENIFVLTKMYKLFFDGRYKHTINKQESKNVHLTIGEPEDHFEKYEVLALISILEDSIFQELNLDMRRTRRFLNEIKKKRDPLGIVVHVNSENKAVFEHHTYAEYFACMFLSYNFDKARVLRKHLFSNKYKNLLLILNIMLAEENPLHLGVIYKDLQQIEKHINDGNVYDRAGRNPLHLVACDGGEYVDLRTVLDPMQVFQTPQFLRFVESVIESKLIISYVLQNDPLERDELFNWNCLDYACQTYSLHAMEMILQKYKTVGEITKHDNLFEPEVFFFLYLIVTGSSNLFSAILVTVPTDIIRLIPKLVLHVTITYCFFNKVEMLTFLIRNDADLEYNYRGTTPLQLATRMKKFNVVTLLVKHGANTDIVAENGDTLMHCALRDEKFESENYFPQNTLKQLKDKTTGECYLSRCKNIDLVRYFHEKGVTITAENRKGETPFHVAALDADFEVCKFLYENNADVNVVTMEKMSVLHYAVMGDNLDVIAFVASKVSDINIQNDEGATPLLMATKMKHLQAAELLHNAGANSLIVSNKNVHLVEVLHKEWLSCLLEAGSNCDIELIKYAGTTGMLNPTAVGKNGITLLHVAARTDLELTKFVLGRGLDVDCLTYDGVHAIQFAVYSGKVDIVEFLLDKVDVDRIVLDHGTYPLSVAVKDGCLQQGLLVQATVFINSLEDKRLYNIREKLKIEFCSDYK